MTIDQVIKDLHKLQLDAMRNYMVFWAQTFRGWTKE